MSGGFAPCSLRFAFQPKRSSRRGIPRIGFLIDSSASDPATALRLDAFRQGLRELGYVEGKNIIVEHRYAEGKSERLTELAEDLARLKVDIFVVPNDTTARAAKKATPAIPIVMASSGNPIGTGVIASLARPGGNVTGLTSYSAELLGKRLELLKEVLPKVSRFAFLNDASSEVSAARVAFKEAQGPAKALGVQLAIRGRKSPESRFRGCIPSDGQGAHWRSDHVPRPAHGFSPKKDFATSRTKPHPRDTPDRRMGGQRWSHVIWGEQSGSIPPRRYVSWTRF